MLIEPTARDQHSQRPVTILLADDDPDDRELIREALLSVRATIETRFVTDGQDLLDYLRRTGRWVGPSADAPHPQIILLDLNMPRKDGREALAELKADEHLRKIPVIVLSTSSDDTDIATVYDLGGSSFITKPSSFRGLIEVMDVLRTYWFGTVTLPAGTG